MLIVERRLQVVENDGAVSVVAIRVFASPEIPNRCRFELHWPDGREDAEVFGRDQREAIDLALRMITARLPSDQAGEADWLQGDGVSAMWSTPASLKPARLDA